MKFYKCHKLLLESNQADEALLLTIETSEDFFEAKCDNQRNGPVIQCSGTLSISDVPQLIQFLSEMITETDALSDEEKEFLKDPTWSWRRDFGKRRSAHKRGL